MVGYTENNIVIMRDFDHVFDLSNRIDLWTKLFTEYKEAELLEQNGNVLKFRLTTFPEGERPSRSWVSTRNINKVNKCATAERIDPTFPFEYMKIRWEYEPLPSANAVIMTWIQEFEAHQDCQFSTVELESFLNRNTRKQMKSVKKNIERWQGSF